MIDVTEAEVVTAFGDDALGLLDEDQASKRVLELLGAALGPEDLALLQDPIVAT